jgi:hypothetical protein
MDAALAELRAKFESSDRSVESACNSARIERSKVLVLGVIKKQPRWAVEEYVRWCRERSLPAVVGVNYVQEYRELVQTISMPPDRAHFIGRLQKNKVKDAVALFDVIETVDSAELARLIDVTAQKAGKIQKVLLQVNISDDPGKGGFSASGVIEFMRQYASTLTHLSIEGLMTITRYYETAEEARPDFRKLAELRAVVAPGSEFHLSMGMSQDFVVAIAEGATLIRLGTALFGERKI